MPKFSLKAEFLAEFVGTMVLLAFGNGVVAMVVLFGHSQQGEIVNGGYTNITLAWGLGVTLAVYIAGRVSGAHLNPAVTLTLAVFRGFPWRKVAPYFVAQISGAFTGAALVFWEYRPQLDIADPLRDHTAGVFTTFPAFPNIPSAGMYDQILGTALLLLVIFAVTDRRNLAPAGSLAPILVGFSVVAIGMSFGSLYGYAINPARDFGPRLLTVIVGFKKNGLTDGSNAFLIPIIGPLLGGLAGGALYDAAIGYWLRNHTPEPTQDK
ncbi:MAG: MIP/aquaporin family protein [Bryobacteraceae bacterium]